MIVDERHFATIEAASRALAAALAAALREALSARGAAIMAVSGGRTPRRVFERLRKADVDWSRVTVTLTDERWVPVDHPESNEGLVRSRLLQDRASAAGFVPLFGGEASAEAGRPACEARLAGLTLPFDAVYLGIGEDGHVASLFPGEPAVEARDGRCVAVPGTGSRLPRMSLTLPAILAATKIFVLFAGEAKRAAYAEAKDPGGRRDVPLRLVLANEAAPVHVLTGP